MIEQTLTDGLFDFVPPRSSVVEVDDDTPELLARLRVLAAEVETPDIVLRARLRCATADAQLTLDASEDDIAKAYNDLIDDASAGRYRHARGLITSRAAYAHAVRGLSSRAIKLWRQSIIASSEHGYYGDVRLAARAARYLARDCGDTEVDKWNVMAIVQALPDQNRLLGERIDPALLAYATAHSDKLVDAFGSARHYLFTTRVGGYLQEHQSALKLFGDVLDEAQEPAEAVWCYVAAGETDKAAKLARSLPTPVDVSAWSQSPLRRRRAAAIQATAAQAQVIPDLDVEPAVEALLENVDGSWRTGLGPTPQVDALKAITSFGARIPESAVDRILKIAGPMIEGDPQQPFELAALLVNTYYAVPSRRGDLSAAIASLLRSPKPPHDLWNLVTQLPAETCGPLLPAVTTMTGEGNRLALRALSRWSPGATASQLQARRACAALLRKPHGPERAVVIGTQEAETVQLLLGLLDLQAPVEFSSDVCVNHEPVIVGLTYITRSTTDDASAEPPAGRTPEEPDETASIAVGPVLDLAIAVADKLMLLAEDRHDAAGSRARVVTALRQLIPRLPSATAASLAPRLFELHENPGLSETDLAEIESDHPLSRARFPLGADRLSPRAVTAAAAAFARSRVQATPVTEDERVFVSRVLAVAAQLLLNDQLAVLGALAIRDIAGSSTTFYHLAFSLLLHGNEGVRTIGVRSAQVSAADLESLVNDPSAAVRAAVAERAGELPSHLHAVLAADTDRHVRRSAQAALADQNGGRQV
ncbi:MAG TPA: hypothetical protein VM347_42400 [Nonomuraea sp.]|nr:hypothetical protein [Nonomuraea sp.]